MLGRGEVPPTQRRKSEQAKRVVVVRRHLQNRSRPPHHQFIITGFMRRKRLVEQTFDYVILRHVAYRKRTASKAGTVALTYFKRSDPYFRCPTRELADYTTTIVGLTALQSVFGVTPNVSDKTGEPEYEGQTKLIVDTLRSRAGVRSFDQAVSMCALGGNARKVTVINAPAEPFYMPVVFVFDESLKATYWMAVFMLHRVK